MRAHSMLRVKRLLAQEGGAKAPGNHRCRQAAAEAPADGGIDLRRGRVRLDQGPHRVEEDRTNRLWQHARNAPDRRGTNCGWLRYQVELLVKGGQTALQTM